MENKFIKKPEKDLSDDINIGKLLAEDLIKSGAKEIIKKLTIE